MKRKDATTLLISESYPPEIGGVANSAGRTAAILKDMVKEVIVFAFDRTLQPGMTRLDDIDGIRVCLVGPFAKEDLTLQLSGNIIRHLLSDYPVQVLHGFYSLHPGYLAVFHAKLAGLKSLVNVRGNDLDRGMFQWKYHSMLLWSLSQADLITCVSRELAEKCRVLSNRDDICYTPNSVDLALFHPQPRSEELNRKFGIDHELVLGFFGELRMKKGITFLLEAFREVSAVMPVRLFLVGGVRREDRHFLEAFLQNNRCLYDRVVMIDYTRNREELCSLYNLVDIVLAPSLWEGMPNSVLEAMACEKIVISSDAGGAKDIICDGENGFLIKTRELHMLKDNILRAVSLKPREKRKIQSRARCTMEDSFSGDEERRNLSALYDRLLRDA